MENSYFRSPYNPIRHSHRNHDFPQQSPKPSSKPKVVSIPVRFVESVAESNKRHSAAVRIQRHLRGFLVRRKVEAVRRIEVEVDEIGKRIQRDLELLLGEEKERVRTNEMLMALLLRLDSVRGVRDYRRKVIRRVILLQETVDSLAAAAAAKPEETGGKPLEDQEDAAPEDHETLGKQDKKDAAPEDHETLRKQDKKDAAPEDHETLRKQEEAAVMEFQETPDADGVRELPEETLLNQELEINGTRETTTIDQETPEKQEEEAVRFQGTLENKRDQELVKEDAFVVEPMECQEERTGEDQEIPVKEIGVVDEKVFPMEGDDECSMIEEALEKDEPALKLERPEKENSEGLGIKSVMERMVAENQTLKSMVAELCERSSLQCQLMGGLAKRVAQLEKTVQAMEKRKKKKRESK